MNHLLKTIEPYWSALERGEKTFEVRRNDRSFQRGDTLTLRKWKGPTGWDRRSLSFGLPDNETYHELYYEVTYVLQGGQFGIDAGHCVLGLKRIAEVPK